MTSEPGRLNPFAVQASDGSNGEKRMLMSLSSWHFVVLQAPTPASAWLFPLLGVGVVGLAESWLVRRVRRTA